MKRSRSSSLQSRISQSKEKTSISNKNLDDNLFLDCLYEETENIIFEETEEFVTHKIREVENEIDKLPGKLKGAYHLALKEEIKQNKQYVRRKEILLPFLRTVGFQPPRAALLLAKFLKYKLDLFGSTMLPRYIDMYNDLNEDDKALLSAGVFYFDEVDCGGRLVCFIHIDRVRSLGFINDRFANTMMRVAFYLIMFAMEHNKRWDQKKGIVVIRYGLHSTVPLKEHRIFFGSFLKMFTNALPIKFAAVHLFLNNPIGYACIEFAKMLVAKHALHRAQTHYVTSAAACLSLLSSYGIDVTNLPLSTSGDFKEEIIQNFLKQILQIELSKMPRQEDHNNQYILPKKLDEISSLEKNSSFNGDIYCSIIGDSNSLQIKQPVVVKEDSSFSNKNIVVRTKTKKNKASSKSAVQGDDLPFKLMEILQSNVFLDAIWWSRDGTAFVIERTKFSNSVLPKVFSGIKFDSFLRRLRRWKFQRLTQKIVLDRVEYQHKLFRRNQPELLECWDNNKVDDSVKHEKFPDKLMNVINTNNNQSIWWVYDGKAFTVKMDMFSSDVLKKDFEGIKISSFLRMMRKWGFKRLPEGGKEGSTITTSNNNVLIFQHDLFQRNLEISQPAILKYWAEYDKVPNQFLTSLGRENFPRKLYRILCSEKAQHAIWWTNNGTAFAIREIDFICDVLPEEYSGIKFSSFKRNLQRWGFKTRYHDAISRNASVFEHPFFLRSKPELLKNLEKNNEINGSDS